MTNSPKTKLGPMTLPSFHDDYLVGYAVDCDARQVVLRIRDADSSEIREVKFYGVEGYMLENDAFGNIICHLEQVPPAQILKDEEAQIREMYRQSGAPGSWAADLALAEVHFERQSVTGFLLAASYGMSGWVIARSVEVVADSSTRKSIVGRCSGSD